MVERAIRVVAVALTCVANFLMWFVMAILVCWALGGLIAVGLAALSPEFYRNTFIRVPEEFGPMLKYAWVGGSILGGQFGGVLTAILGSIIFRNAWKRQQIHIVD